MTRSELIDTVSNLLAALAAVIQVVLVLALLLLIASRFSPRARSFGALLRDSVFGVSIWPAAAIAIVATAGSLFFSEYADFIPCTLCWYQRIAMYPLAVLLTIAAVRRDVTGAVVYGLPLCAIGAAFAVYHVYIEVNPDAELGFCQAGGASCATKWIEVFGYVTIPVLALTAFAAIGGLILSVRSAARAATNAGGPGSA